MATVKAWLASAALVGGAGGGAAVWLAAPGSAAAARPAGTSRPSVAVPDAAVLQQQIDSLLREDHALKRAVARARLRLAGEVHASEGTLAALRRRIVAAEHELAQAQAARNLVRTTTVAPRPSVPASSPAPHATTGASGAGTGGTDGEREGGSDD